MVVEDRVQSRVSQVEDDEEKEELKTKITDPERRKDQRADFGLVCRSPRLHTTHLANVESRLELSDELVVPLSVVAGSLFQREGLLDNGRLRGVPVPLESGDLSDSAGINDDGSLGRKEDELLVDKSESDGDHHVYEGRRRGRHQSKFERVELPVVRPLDTSSFSLDLLGAKDSQMIPGTRYPSQYPTSFSQ